MAVQSEPDYSLFTAQEMEFVAEDELIEIVPNMRMDPLNLICGDFGPFLPQIATQVPLWLAVALKKRGKCTIRPPEWMSLVLQTLEDVKVLSPVNKDDIVVCITCDNCPEDDDVLGPSAHIYLINIPDYWNLSLLDNATVLGYPEKNKKLTRVLEAERDSEREFQLIPFHYVEISRLLFDHARDDIPDIYMVRSLIEDIRDVRFHKVQSSLETFDGRTSAVQIKSLSAMEVNIVRPFVARALQSFQKLDSLLPETDSMPNNQPQEADKTSKGRRVLRGR